MISLKTQLQSALLASMMLVSANTFGSIDLGHTVASCVSHNKMASVVVALLVAAKIRLMTKPRANHSMKDFKEDVKTLLTSLNILDPKVRAHIIDFVDKYVVGVEYKIEETSTKTKNEDGSVFTIKGSKLTQKPFGIVGLLDAYVLAQVKKITDYIPTVAAFYLLINDPYKSFGAATKKIG